MLKTFVDKLLDLLSYKLFPIVVLLIAIPLAWPSVHAGWFADDLLHRTAYIDTPDAKKYHPTDAALQGPMRMYSFFDGDEEHFHKTRDLGGIPWWCSPNIRAMFWRPITALFSMLDYHLWPNSSEWMHVHSLCWFAVLVIVSALAYRSIMGPGWAAGFAVLLYVINDIHVFPIAFLANRHILIAAVFGIASFDAFIRWREQRQMVWLCVSNVLFSAALLASESGITILGYLLSYSIWIEKGTKLSRIRPLIPYFVIAILWRSLYTSLGYGVSGLELYVDPGNDPVKFAYAVVERVPMILLNLLAFPPTDIYMILSPFAVKAYWIVSVLILCCLGCLFSPYFRQCRSSLFWLSGTLLAIIPLCAALPGGRSLALVSFGMTGFLVQIIQNAVKSTNANKNFCSRRNLSMAILVGIILLRLSLGSFNFNQAGHTLQALQKGIDTISNLDVDDPELANQDVILVNPVFTIGAMYYIPIRIIARKPIPAHFRVLGSGLESIRISRIDERTIIARPRDGYMSPPRWNDGSLTSLRTYVDLVNVVKKLERLIANQDTRFTKGQEIALTGVTIQITDVTGDNRPAEAAFVFDFPLEDPSLRWLQWNKAKSRYEDFIVPNIGESVTLK